MAHKRYQIFVASSGQQMQHDYDMVCQKLINLGHFVSGICNRQNIKAETVRRQIDHSDYIVLLIGDHYGQQEKCGMSALHLEYIYTVARQKPIFIISLDEISHHQTLDQQQKLSAFKISLKKQNPYFLSYLSCHHMVKALKPYLFCFIQDYPAMGWVKDENTVYLTSQITDLNDMEQLTKRH